ncbi:hypothetical protein H4S14_002988 [Agrobacterium vitis]|nr:hypothetical protein [Agrobacterium vitis]MBE1439226.1 hypothetical protein [Agrobacterium vitis]
MWFLIKGTFWFTLVLVALSFLGGSPNDGQNTGSRDGQSASTSQFQLANAISAATGTYDYLSGLCSTKPDVCVKGAQTLSAIGERAREGALVAYQLIDRHLGDGSATASPPEQMVEQDNSSIAADRVVTGAVSHPTVINIPKPKAKPSE